jgi:hypothetical protein
MMERCNIALCPFGYSEVKVIHFDVNGTWYFGVHFGQGKGKSFNTYTRGHLKDNVGNTLWEGWLSGMPDPMDPDSVPMYEWCSQNARVRRWLDRKIKAAWRYRDDP